MKRIALGAVVAAAVAVTACTSSAAPVATGATGSAAPSGGTAAPAAQSGCGQQYRDWGQGQGKGVMAALATVSAASTTGNAQVLNAEMRKVKPIVAKAARNPLPGCADPRGYWPVLMMHMTAAVSSTGSAAGARAAMKGVPAIEQALVAELTAVVGTS